MNDFPRIPPPVIDSARLLAYAHVDEDVQFTDRITLFVDEGRLGRVPRLAITRNYCDPGEILLEFCDESWKVKGVIAFATLEEAKLRAERGYAGITKKWKSSPYTDHDVNQYLREVYEVDPSAEWWTLICSFCSKDVDEGAVIVGARASICEHCIRKLYADLTADDA